MIYTYDHCKLLRVVDGDTYEIEIDYGFYTKHVTHLRLAGINTPEKTGREKAAGINVTNIVTEALFDLVTLNNYQVCIQTTDKPKFAKRSIGHLFIADGPEYNAAQVNWTGVLLNNKLGRAYDGGKRKPLLIKEIKRIAELDKFAQAESLSGQVKKGLIC